MILEDELLANFPDDVDVPAELVADSVSASDRVLVVLDDDPTGTQSVADLPVLTAWEPSDFRWAFGLKASGRGGEPKEDGRRPAAVYVLTNTRSLDPVEAAERNRAVVANALAAARDLDLEIAFVSRSDSTLRGHFPLETDTIADALEAQEGRGTDGVVIVPAFPDAGRVTIGGTHYTRGESGALTPVAETEFARDATFGYASSSLAEYVEEKSRGRYSASGVIVLDLTILRTGTPGESATAIADALEPAEGRTPIVVDIVTENDLRRLALGLAEAERRGKRLIYRVGPPFVRGRIGQEVRAPLSSAEALGGDAPQRGGLVVVGSHVGQTTRQLEALLRRLPSARVVELDVERVLAGGDAHVAETAGRVAAALETGDVVVHTSRTLVTADDAAGSLAIARLVSAALVDVVRQTVAAVRPRFVVAKGGITSSDVAAHGLGIRRAIVRGPMLPGIVSLWEPMEGPALGIPYIVFAGNVGDDESLADVVGKLSAVGEPSAVGKTYKVAVLGLGAMGLPMATRLATRLTVHGFDIAEERLALAKESGVETFGSARQAVSGVDTVLLAVRNGAQLEDVLFGEAGVAPELTRGAVVILTSTVGTEAVGAAAQRLTELGIDLVDAPLSGGPVRAGNGDLLVVVGAPPSALERARPVLDLLASTLSVVGDHAGDGQALKTVNQLLCGVHIAAAAEALALADALGLDRARTLDALTAGAAGSFMLGDRGRRMLSAYDDGGAPVLSRLDIFVKDLGIVGRAARTAGLPTPVAAAAEQLFLLGQSMGLEAEDDSAVIRVLAPELRGGGDGSAPSR